MQDNDIESRSSTPFFNTQPIRLQVLRSYIFPMSKITTPLFSKTRSFSLYASRFNRR